ncbi:hypothetical protein ACVWZ6_002684 [Bradyrhizobium sp. GM6.1]
MSPNVLVFVGRQTRRATNRIILRLRSSATIAIPGLGCANAHAQQNSPRLTLQLRSWKVSESIGNHDSEIVDAGGADRRDACVVGGGASRGQDMDASVVHARAVSRGILGRGNWDADALRDIVRDYVIEHLADHDPVLVTEETGFSSRARRRAEWQGNTPVRPAGSRTARLESSLPTFRATVMRLSIVRCIFRRNGPKIQIAWKPHKGSPMSALRPNQSSRRE